MTSRVSFHKLIIESLRRHLATVLITVLFFFIHIISFFLNVQNIVNTKIMEDAVSSYYPQTRGTEYVIKYLTELCSPSIWNAILAMLIGVFLAFDFFRYLHSKKETDFYEAMPIRKQTRFKMILIACIGIFIILSVITIGIELAIVYGVGYGSTLILKNMLWNLVCMIGCFLACFTTTVLAMTMTGHSIIALLGLGVFASYIPLIISNLIPLYAANFFDTYVYREINDKYYYFSPITLAYKASHTWNYNGNIWNIKEHWTYLLGCFIFALVIGLIAYFLFLRRPSETAGRAMAFEKFNPVIRFMIVIPIALYAGLFLNEISAYANTAWLIFGLIFAAFLMHGIMECLFQFDIKALVCKKKQLLFSILFCLAFVFVFWIDAFQYDNFVPDEKDIKSIHIDTYLFDQNGKYVDEWKNGLTGEYVDAALTAIKDIRNHMESSDSVDYIYTNNFEVTYELKNGVKRKRSYPYYGNDFPESLDKLSTTEEFKDDFCVLYHLDKVDISSVSIFNGAQSFNINLSEEKLREFSEIYRNEYTNLSFSESLSKEAIYKLIVSYPLEGEDYSVTAEYKIYSDFTDTLDFLKDYNIISFKDSQDIKLENLEIYSDKYDKDGHHYISDENQLNELKQHMLLGDFMYHRYEYSEDYVYCNLRYVQKGAANYIDVYIKDSDLSKIIGQ